MTPTENRSQESDDGISEINGELVSLRHVWREPDPDHDSPGDSEEEVHLRWTDGSGFSMQRIRGHEDGRRRGAEDFYRQMQYLIWQVLDEESAEKIGWAYLGEEAAKKAGAETDDEDRFFILDTGPLF